MRRYIFSLVAASLTAATGNAQPISLKETAAQVVSEITKASTLDVMSACIDRFDKGPPNSPVSKIGEGRHESVNQIKCARNLIQYRVGEDRRLRTTTRCEFIVVNNESEDYEQKPDFSTGSTIIEVTKNILITNDRSLDWHLGWGQLYFKEGLIHTTLDEDAEFSYRKNNVTHSYSGNDLDTKEMPIDFPGLTSNQFWDLAYVLSGARQACHLRSYGFDKPTP